MPENPKTVTVNLPAGMTAEAFAKSMASFQKMAVYTKLHDKAVRNALNSLKKQYPADYTKYLNTELKAVGLKVKA